MKVRHAFVDESGRGSGYYVCAAVVPVSDVEAVRRLARDQRMPGQDRWHFVSERPSRRKTILDAIVRSQSVRVHVYYGKGREVPLRAAIFAKLGVDLMAAGVRRLVIESRASRDQLDRRVLFGVVDPAELHYEHRMPKEDPGLWIADAVSWSYSAGGRWRDQMASIVDVERNLGTF